MFKYLINLFLCFSLFNTAYAGEIKKKGDVLEEDSMVFTLEEAQKSAKYISGLESKVEQKNALLREKDNLITNLELQNQQSKSILSVQEEIVKKHQELRNLDLERIKRLEREAKTKRLEVIGGFLGGVALTAGLLVVADQLDDKVFEASPRSSNQNSGLRVRF